MGSASRRASTNRVRPSWPSGSVSSSFAFAWSRVDGSLVYVQRRRGIPVWAGSRCGYPAAFAPRVDAREDPAGPASVNLNVRVTLPGVGLLIAYDGIVNLEDTRA